MKYEMKNESGPPIGRVGVFVELSIIVPVFNSGTIFPELYREVCESVGPVVSSFELLAVIDGCVDDSSKVVGKLCIEPIWSR